ncbi:MAG: hypothetical protein MJK14_13010 [Rivularia sp. ALOHA_DT_140]|nr:hypothetical protein [Rivularia sp. ALOHA_DT_140]
MKELNEDYNSLQVKGFASRLLKESGGEKGKQALLEFDPYLYFTKLDDWEVEEFNPEVGIVNPEGKASLIMEHLISLINENRLQEVENLLYFLKNYNFQYLNEQEYHYINILLTNSQIWNTYKQFIRKE